MRDNLHLWSVTEIIQKIQYKAFPGTQQNRLEGLLSIEISDPNHLSWDAGRRGASGAYFQFGQSSDSLLGSSCVG